MSVREFAENLENLEGREWLLWVEVNLEMTASNL